LAVVIPDEVLPKVYTLAWPGLAEQSNQQHFPYTRRTFVGDNRQRSLVEAAQRIGTVLTGPLAHVLQAGRIYQRRALAVAVDPLRVVCIAEQWMHYHQVRPGIPTGLLAQVDHQGAGVSDVGSCLGLIMEAYQARANCRHAVVDGGRRCPAQYFAFACLQHQEISRRKIARCYLSALYGQFMACSDQETMPVRVEGRQETSDACVQLCSFDFQGLTIQDGQQCHPGPVISGLLAWVQATAFDKRDRLAGDFTCQ